MKVLVGLTVTATIGLIVYVEECFRNYPLGGNPSSDFRENESTEDRDEITEESLTTDNTDFTVEAKR